MKMEGNKVAIVNKTKEYLEMELVNNLNLGMATSSSFNKKAGAITNVKEKANMVCIMVLSVGKLKKASIK
jgi:hypothetical protein